MPGNIKTITFNNLHQQKHFDFFNQMNHPHFNITVELEVETFINFVKDKNIKFTQAMVFAIAKAANTVEQFKWRIRNDKIVMHQYVDPSYAINTKASSVFSFCTVSYKNNLATFTKEAQQIELMMQQKPSFEDEPGRDDYLFLSSTPWFHFTAIQHAMHYHPCDSVPRFTFGKYLKKEKHIMMPLSIQAHHALVNGKEVGSFLELLHAYLKHPNLL